MRLRKRTDGRCAPLPTLSWLLVLCILSSQQRPSTNRAAVYHVVAAGRRAAGGRVNATASPTWSWSLTANRRRSPQSPSEDKSVSAESLTMSPDATDTRSRSIHASRSAVSASTSMTDTASYPRVDVIALPAEGGRQGERVLDFYAMAGFVSTSSARRAIVWESLWQSLASTVLLDLVPEGPAREVRLQQAKSRAVATGYDWSRVVVLRTTLPFHDFIVHADPANAASAVLTQNFFQLRVHPVGTDGAVAEPPDVARQTSPRWASLATCLAQPAYRASVSWTLVHPQLIAIQLPVCPPYRLRWRESLSFVFSRWVFQGAGLRGDVATVDIARRPDEYDAGFDNSGFDTPVVKLWPYTSAVAEWSVFPVALAMAAVSSDVAGLLQIGRLSTAARIAQCWLPLLPPSASGQGLSPSAGAFGLPFWPPDTTRPNAEAQSDPRWLANELAALRDTTGYLGAALWLTLSLLAATIFAFCAAQFWKEMTAAAHTAVVVFRWWLPSTILLPLAALVASPVVESSAVVLTSTRRPDSVTHPRLRDDWNAWYPGLMSLAGLVLATTILVHAVTVAAVWWQIPRRTFIAGQLDEGRDSEESTTLDVATRPTVLHPPLLISSDTDDEPQQRHATSARGAKRRSRTVDDRLKRNGFDGKDAPLRRAVVTCDRWRRLLLGFFGGRYDITLFDDVRVPGVTRWDDDSEAGASTRPWWNAVLSATRFDAAMQAWKPPKAIVGLCVEWGFTFAIALCAGTRPLWGDDLSPPTSFAMPVDVATNVDAANLKLLRARGLCRTNAIVAAIVAAVHVLYGCIYRPWNHVLDAAVAALIQVCVAVSMTLYAAAVAAGSPALHDAAVGTAVVSQIVVSCLLATRTMMWLVWRRSTTPPSLNTNISRKSQRASDLTVRAPVDLVIDESTVRRPISTDAHSKDAIVRVPRDLPVAEFPTSKATFPPQRFHKAARRWREQRFFRRKDGRKRRAGGYPSTDSSDDDDDDDL